MKIKIFLLLVTITGVLAMAGFDQQKNEVVFSEYSSKDPLIGISMQYPSGWRVIEDRGANSNYAQAQFIEMTQNELAATFVVTAKEKVKTFGSPLTLKEIADDLMTKRMLLLEANVIKRSDTLLNANPAILIELTYKTPDKLYSTEAKLVSIQERILLIERGKNYYTVRYTNISEDFNRFLPAFELCVNSLKFLDPE
jgi:hypothetical protein